jgi:hypothetical protein
MVRRKSATRAPNDKTCNEITALVLDYLTDKLTPAVRRAFVRHLRLCTDCVSFLNTYKKTVAAIGTIETETLPPKVRKNVLAFLRKRIYRAGKGFLFAVVQLSFFTVPWL